MDAFDPASAIAAEANAQGVDPALANAIAMQGEGNGHYLSAGARSPAGAIGPMQLMPSTAAGLGVDPTDPAQNVHGGVKYLKQLSDQFGGDPTKIAAAYNAGPQAVVTHGGVPPYKETQGYVQRVTGALEPSQADLKALFSLPEGSRQVTPAPGGGVSDPATGETYIPAGDGLVQNAAGDKFKFVQPDAEPSQADLKALFTKDQPNAPTQGEEKPTTIAGVAAQGAQGLAEMGAGMGQSLGFGRGIPFINDATDNIAGLLKSALGNGVAPPTTADFMKPLQDVTGTPNAVSPGSVLGQPQIAGEPGNFAERAARIGTPYVAGALFPGGLGTRVANSVLPALGAVGASEAARGMNATPGEQQTASMIGGGLGGLAGFGIANPKGALGGLTALTEPFAAKFSAKAAEGQAGRVLAGAATDLPAARGALSGYEPILPGSPATLGDITGDTGLLSLARTVAQKNEAAYIDLQSRQSGARNQALASVQSGADPMAVRTHIASTIEGLDAATDKQVQAVQQAAQAKAQAIGGTGTPEGYGADVRQATQAALDASDVRESALWKAIDPDGKVTVGVAPPRVAARNIAGDLTADSLPMSSDEKAIFDRVSAWPDSLPLKNVVEMRKQINAVASQAKATGNDVTYGRLSALRSAIVDNLSNAASAQPGAAARMEAWDAGTGDVGSGSNQQVATAGAPSQAGAGGTALSASGGPGGASGDQGISPDLTPIKLNGKVVGYTTPSGENLSAAQATSYEPPAAVTSSPAPPNFDADTQGRINAANAATAEQKQTYGAKPVSPVLATNGFKGQYTMPDGRVASQFFHPGPTGFSDMQAIAKASPEALPIVQDYAASDLRSKAMNADGTIDPAKFSRWQAANADSLRALPDALKAKFADAATASQTLADAQVAKVAAVKAAQTGAIGKILGAPDAETVTKYVGSILRGANSTGDMQALADATAKNPQARAGLQQAIVDHITNNFISNTEAGASGVNKVSANAYQMFIKTAQPALAKVLDPKQLDTLNRIGADITQGQRTLQATKLPGGSDTYQNLIKGGLPGAGGPARRMIDGLAAIIGSHLEPGLGGLATGLASGAAADWIQALRAQGITKVADLVTEGVLNPTTTGARLLATVKGPITPQSSQGQALLRALAGPAAVALANQHTKAAPTLRDAVESRTLRGITPPQPSQASALQGVQ